MSEIAYTAEKLLEQLKVFHAANGRLMRENLRLTEENAALKAKAP